MKRTFLIASIAVPLVLAAWLFAQPSRDPLMEGFRMVEVASVADAMEQLYGQRGHMSHEMRPVFTTKFAGPAVTVLMKKEEHKEGGAASQGMLDAIDAAPPGAVYVMVMEGEGNADVAGIGGLMATAMRYRGLAGAVMAMFFYIYPDVGASFALIAYVTVALGGFGSVFGAFAGGIIVGPVPLPTRIEKFCVTRSPNIDKDSREQFEIRTHKRLIDIQDPTSKAIDALTQINVASGVEIDIKL